MSAVYSRRHLALYSLFTGVLLNSNVIAQGGDSNLSGLAISLQYETVGDTVDYSPNLPEGGFSEADQRPRFASSGLAFSHISRQGDKSFLSVKQRTLNSLRDSFTVNEVSVGISRNIELPTLPRHSLDFSIDARVNHASEIRKNSYTSYADTSITQVKFLEPEDARLTVALNLTISLTDYAYVTAGLGGGFSRTDVRNVNGVAILDNNCRYNFTATSHGGSVQQAEPCGDLISYEQYYPDNQKLTERLGVSVTDDLTYRDYFLAPKLSLHWQQGVWALSTGYEFRQYYRPSLDHRIRQSGGTPVARNHTAFAEVQVFLFKHWQAGAGIRYQRAAFLDDIPFLYNALTYERYNSKGVLRYNMSLTRYFN